MSAVFPELSLTREAPTAIQRVQPGTMYPLVKRAFDILATLLCAQLILAVVGALVLLVRSDGGPAFYSQPRLGKDGRVFKLWKLRTMVPDAERALARYLEQNPAARVEWDRDQKLISDPRITPVGRYLRKYSLDEVPQFYKVLVGEMSLIGPRPMLPEQRDWYPGTAYYDVLPGMTGLWQISTRNHSSFAERATYDTHYASTMSFAVDLRILLVTFLVVFKGTGL